MNILMAILVAVALLAVLASSTLLFLFIVTGSKPESDEGAETESETASDSKQNKSLDLALVSEINEPAVINTVDPFTGYMLDDEDRVQFTLTLPGDQRIILAVSSMVASMLSSSRLRQYASALRELEGNYSVQCCVLEDGEMREVPGADLYNIIVGSGILVERLNQIDELREQAAEATESENVSEEGADDDVDDESQDMDSGISPDSVMTARTTSPDGSGLMDLPIDEPARDLLESDEESEAEAVAEQNESAAAQEVDNVEPPEANEDLFVEVAVNRLVEAAMLSAPEKVEDAMPASGMEALAQMIRSDEIAQDDLRWNNLTPVPRRIMSPSDAVPPVPPSDFDPNTGLND